MSRVAAWFNDLSIRESLAEARIVEQRAGQRLLSPPAATTPRTIAIATPQLDETNDVGTVVFPGIGMPVVYAPLDDIPRSHAYPSTSPATPRPQVSPRADERDVPHTAFANESPVQYDLRSFVGRLFQALLPSVDWLLAESGPLDWPQPLLPYQVVGARELIARDELLLADDMGLGKTIQSIAALRALVLRREVASALIVVPSSLISQWRREVRLWAPELRVSTIRGTPQDRSWQWRTPAHLYLVSYETLRADFTENPHAPVARLWDLVVLDEAQKIKNADTDVSYICKRLHRARQWALTGTPLENSIDDLRSLLAFVSPGTARQLSSFSAPAELRAALGQVQLRRRKADVLTELPPKRNTRVLLPLAPRQQQTYDRAEREGILELRQLGQSVQIQNVLELIVRLKQICNFCPVSSESSKLADLRERLDTLKQAGHKALVFSQFSNEDEGVRAIAARLDPPALTFTGDQPFAERDRVVQAFREDASIPTLVLSLRAGGQGLNLQEASYVFHFDRWWNPAVEQQAESRSHRMGQQHPVNVYTYICENTIEERIDEILQQKQALFDDLVDGVSIDLPARMNASELFGLFNLAPPRHPSSQ